MKSQIFITPSILSANLANLQAEVDTVSTADWLQIDVMDGHFVPNLSFGAPVIKNIQTSLPLDVHLMVTNPEERIEEFLALNVYNITFHAEVTEMTDTKQALIAAIHDGGSMASIALNPTTPASAMFDVLDEIDMVVIMAVNPGFGGQSFQESVLSKIAEIRTLRPELMIQVDGGINEKTARLCIEAGANNIVAGNFIFSAPNRAAQISALRSCV